MNVSINSKNRLLELDALRGVAAVLVVFFHFTMSREEAKYGFKLGVTGVDLFFIISGFVIFLTLEKTNDWKDFVVSRFSRLYPTYWACVTLTAIVIIINIHANGSLYAFYLKYLANMTMFQFYLNTNDLDGPYWTMMVEMLFYIYMLIIFLVRKLKQIELIGFCSLLPVFIYRIPYIKENFGYLFRILFENVPIITHFPLFFAGIIFYKIKFEKRTWIQYGLICLCFLAQISLFYAGGKSRFFISFYEYIFMLTIYFLTFILYTTNNLKFIINRVTLFLGNISFPLYLCHSYIGIYIIIPGLIKNLNFNIWFAFATAFFCITIIAYLITRFIEKPAMNSIRNLFRAKSSLIRNYENSIS